MIYPQRLGAANDKLEAGGRRRRRRTDLRILGRFVEHGLRAQARTGNLLTGQLYVAMDFDPKAPKIAFDAKARAAGQFPPWAAASTSCRSSCSEFVDKLGKIPFDSIGKQSDQHPGWTQNHLKQVKPDPAAVHGTLQEAQKTMGPPTTFCPVIRRCSRIWVHAGTSAAHGALGARADRLSQRPSGIADPWRRADAKPPSSSARPPSAHNIARKGASHDSCANTC